MMEDFQEAPAGSIGPCVVPVENMDIDVLEKDEDFWPDFFKEDEWKDF